MLPDNPIRDEAADRRPDGLLFRLIGAERQRGDGDWRIARQLSATHMLIAATGGRGRLTLEGDEVPLRPGAVVAIAPGQTFGGAAEPSGELELYLLRFDALCETWGPGKKRLLQAHDKPILPARTDRPAAPAGRLASMCESIHGCWHSPDALERFRGQILFQELLYSIWKDGLPAHDDARPALDRAKDYIERHFNENVTIEQLSQIAEVSPKYFVELFKKTYGVSAIDYLTELRIGRAKQLMAQARVKLKEIAHRVGYQDEYYFSRKFKQKTGVTPSEYMSRRRRKIAVCDAAITGQLLPLGIVPYAAPLHPKWTAYYHERYRGEIPVHLSAFRRNGHWEANLETLRQASPGLIVAKDDLDDAGKRELERIAPVIYVPWGKADWRGQLRLAARFLGETDEAEMWLSRYERKIRHARNRLEEALRGETVLVVRMLKGKLFAYSNRSMAEVLFGDLRLVPALDGGGVYNWPLSIERLAEIEPDRLLLLIRQESETLDGWNELRQSWAWQELKAVRGNRVYTIESDPWCEYSASAHDRIVEETVRLFVRK